jgi:hypothetical protein
MPTKDETPHLRLRIEPRLLTRLEKAREKSGRTLTGEISHRLEESFWKDDTEAVAIKAARKAIAQFLLNDVSGHARGETTTHPLPLAIPTKKD